MDGPFLTMIFQPCDQLVILYTLLYAFGGGDKMVNTISIRELRPKLAKVVENIGLLSACPERD